MSHEHKLAIFRGTLKFKSNTQKIWGVLIFLSIVTTVEVALGITKPEILVANTFIGMKLLNWIFIILTLVKAYYIAWDFMHLRDEKSSLRRAIVWTPIFLVSYLIFILLFEADYIYNVFKDGYIQWNF
ncbi:cytochrome C oxidase subunit IV family protein [Muriicola sp. SD30]|jgi:cytochrome c oxidase subunit IV|uniref:cytochrome C oxidase subunit IV family protein n=1 Tax=Muriicola sp. SD30 TaxID=3240936 RepID=UPI00185B6908|nr:cytochrome C oxidase subunit IV family protein [Muriicola sp.]NNC60715.1 cytochrome C oxidase subunit IV family protein [Eudoraea sp.]NNK20374.1 cytochrome C oxidase subunit IV family protein [Flavobacteriaceae bacterium]MBT8290543.1 cytochrome C oxidase subunit IV family protein [Muriicola sp.]NNK35740.1 cytochrome C oxidase subunit IV family protein [Eudoraea sp.]